ncbi:hypothetical protein [Massilia sp. BJB1822]|uniref:hypothetical protein n=1 Tax=Massilia sp. BJB1822 TaxID=2744470 RepID=UPI0015939E41|nr:hypothetical protein [Massilia sp. BJB1822]NVE01707.1 hypothetical protein [Massilia sp. BJB1822]
MLRLNVGFIAAAMALTACGGGGAGGGSGGEPAGPRSYSIPAPSLYDFTTYAVEQKTSLSAETATFLKSSVMQSGISLSDGFYIETMTYREYEGRNDYHLTGDRGMTGRSSSCEYTFEPVMYEIPATLTLGQTWDHSSVVNRECRGKKMPAYTHRSKGQVLGLETVTVKGGTFDTVKLVNTTSWELSPDKAVSESTIWRDVRSGRIVKEVRVATRSSLTDGKVSYVVNATDELTAFSIAATGQRKMMIEQYAGPWRGSVIGDIFLQCRTTVDNAGAVSVRCMDTSGFTRFSASGTVDAEGEIHFAPNSDASFTGKFTSPQNARGTWTSGNLKGTWAFSHL